MDRPSASLREPICEKPMKLLTQVRNSSLQTGYNHNIRYRGRDYHVQTEDSGVEKGHIHTHVFLGGTVISTAKVEYDPGRLGEPLDGHIVQMMRESHQSMTRALLRGSFDERIHRQFGSIAPPGTIPAPDFPRPSPMSALREPLPPNTKTRLEALKETIDMDSVNKSLEKLQGEITGFLGAALVDHESGMCLGAVGSGINLEVAAAGNMEVVRAKMRVMKDLGIKGDIEDMLITLSAQYHIIRPISSSLFLYLAFDRKTGNLALARHKMATVAAEVVV